jgi:repressor LexA
MMLTAKQRRVYEFILRKISTRGYPPTIREIGAALRISSLRGVTCHLDALERKGYIKREPTSRGISIVRSQDLDTIRHEDMVRLPLLGRIPAGAPHSIEEYAEAEVTIPTVLLKRGAGKMFVLRVTGDSMIGDHILDGDLIIVEGRQTAENGDVVVASVDDETTVKRFFREKDQIRLRASNPTYNDILVSKDFRISGRVVGLLRRMR